MLNYAVMALHICESYFVTASWSMTFIQLLTVVLRVVVIVTKFCTLQFSVRVSPVSRILLDYFTA